MSRFFVGQRVRVVRPDSGSRDRGLLAGAEGVIVEKGVYIDWRVRFFGHVNPRRTRSRDFFPMLEKEIEPVLNKKHEACDEDFKRDLDKLLEKADASQHHA